MKTRLFLVASLFLAVGFTSCSNTLDDENPAPAGKGDKVLIVKLPANMKATRVVEDQTKPGTETGIKDATIFLLTGQLVWKAQEFTEEEMKTTYKRFEQVPVTVDRVIVVANTQQEEDVLKLVTADQVRNYAYSIASQHNGTMLSNRTLIGEATPKLKSDPETTGHDDHDYMEADVTLSAITARMEVGTVVAGEGIEKIELVSLWVNNYISKHKGTETLWPENAVEGYWNIVEEKGINIGQASVDPIGELTIPTYAETSYQQGYSSDVELATNSKVYAFHVFPGNVPNLVMLVKVTLKPDYYEGEAKYKYGFVTFTKFKEGSNYVSAFEAHNVYKMGVGDKGIKIDAKDITDQPNKGKYDLGIEVKIAPWTFHEVTPEV